MPGRIFALCLCTALLTPASFGPRISAESSRHTTGVHRLPLLFERTPDGPVTRSRGLRAAIRSDGAAIVAGAHRIRLEFLGAVAGEVRLEAPQPARINHLKGPRGEWRTNVPTFGRVRLAGLYPGIDAVFYGTDRQLEYDMEVRPGADAARIVAAFHGADRLSIDEHGQLVIALGDRTIVQRAPFAYQERNGTREPVDVRYA